MSENKAFTLQQLAELTNSKLVGDAQKLITSVADLESATEEDVSFLANPRYELAMRQSKAGVVFVSPSVKLMEGRNFLITEDPSTAFQKSLEIFYGNTEIFSGFTHIHPTAVIHDSCKIGKGVTIGPYVVLDQEAKIGDNTFIGSHSYIGPFTTIGESCHIHPHVSIRERCVIKNRVILQPGVVIGSCGYGYTQDNKGRHTKLKQLGNVIVEDDVELGANTTIDRARFKSTRIGRGTKIDNLVVIGHNVKIGEDNLIIGQTGIAGSTETGNHVIIAGQVGIAGHLKLDSGVIVAAKSGVSKSLKAGKYNGIPAMPLHEYNRTQIHIRNLEKQIDKLNNLLERVQKLEGKKG